MSITDELSTLYNTKRSIKQAIISKGVDVPDDTVFADYANKISLISGGNENSGDDFLSVRTLNNTDYSYLFYYYKGTELNLSNFITSNVTNMKSMFQGCNNLTSLDLSNFNTSKVTTMDSMFLNCSKLTELDLSNFNTSKVTTMNMMLRNCSSLTTLDLSNLYTTSVSAIDASSMLLNCTALHTLRLDNCNNTAIKMIISYSSLPTGTISGVTRKIYCKEANAAGLTAPTNWVFEYID